MNFMYGTSPPRSIVPKRGGGTRASLVGIELKSVGCAPTDFIREIGCYLNLGLLLICPYIFCLSYVSPRFRVLLRYVSSTSILLFSSRLCYPVLDGCFEHPKERVT